MVYTLHMDHPASRSLPTEGTGRVHGLDYDEDGNLYARIVDTRPHGGVHTLLRLRVDRPELAAPLAQAIGRGHAVTWTGQWFTHSRPSVSYPVEQTGYLVACTPAPSPSTPPMNTRA